MITFNQKILKDIEVYCDINGLNCDEFANKLLKNAFMLEKYGDKPEILEKPRLNEEKAVEKSKKPKKQKVETVVEEKKEVEPQKIDIPEEEIEEEVQIVPKKRRKLS